MRNYKLINLISGWIVFSVSAIVYLMTVEPTASFWDCGEFITQAYKLEVGHPPGAPIFMLVGNLFSQFTSDPSQVAKMVNIMSALLSAFTILFLFWTITHLTRKLIVTKEEGVLNTGQTIAIIGSGLVGALAYTFSDTFWFSAVESEVYAFSSMLTALVFWLILKWEDNANKTDSDKWIVLIAYVMGLSIGVHLLNLLCIPAIVLVYYFKKNEAPDWKGGIKALLLSFGLIIVLMWGIIPGFTKIGGWFELFFVNSLGFSYHTGTFVYIILLTGVIGWTLYETFFPKGKESRAKTAFFISLGLTGILFISNSAWLWVMLIATGAYFIFRYKKLEIKFINLAATCLLVILIGFSSFAMIPIRSNANPPLDLNSPRDIFSLGSVLSREQYGNRPLFYGSTYASDVERSADGSAVYTEKKQYNRIIKTSPDQKDRYVVSTAVDAYKYTHSMLFTRMHSDPATNPNFTNHIRGYRVWGGVTDENIPPTFFQNLKFLFNYQINHMYWRYFMWNFSGRQNDIQSYGGITSGNWITGIPFFDAHVLGLGPQDNIAPSIVNNKGHNKYYMLPLLLGIIGILFQLQLKKRGKQSFAIVFMLFFMTGIAIVLYLNQTPFEPRERDYAYAGSFYAFSIWIGIGVAGISSFLRKYMNNNTVTTTLVTAATLCIPIQMASQNWDDHDRSERTLARDTGMNYLSCAGENAILFTNGDNDTYPLWYVQETEGFRTDVRVTNLSFLQVKWYIDQLMRQAYESEPLPIKWTPQQYFEKSGSSAFIITRKQHEDKLRERKILPISFSSYFDVNTFKDTLSLKQTMENLKTGQNKPMTQLYDIGDMPVIPGNILTLNVDTMKVDWKTLAAKPSDKMYIDLRGKSSVSFGEQMIMELLTNINDDNWQRPIHFATTIPDDLFLNMHSRNFSLNGLTYQVVPGVPLYDSVNIDATYDNMMNKIRWGGLEKNPDIYFDENCRRVLNRLRLSFAQLVDALIDAGENEKAFNALDKITTMIPPSTMPYGTEGLDFAESYYRLGEKEKAEALIEEINDRINRNLDWFVRLKPAQLSNTLSEVVWNNITHQLLITSIYQQYNKEEYSLLIDDLLQRAQTFYMRGVPYAGDILLKEIANGSLEGYYSTSTGDTLQQRMEEQTMQKAFSMMHQFNPKLLEQYSVKE
ncbi:protein O-mannosyl-transferase family [Proteiniphilum sp.]|uniref:protein O-mannosyl-transferase family n=1 Tax=Proteiniphilum sp. TaxID=1926877 RepID=UPI002B209E71|nr:DUF2723 domain-containing protein [Proteiniphilum sp.]MEA4918474.1 DUF2723 domain-containing protein [Proteiniphilum sp.]